MLDPALAVVVSNPESDKIARKKFVSNNTLTAYVISLNPRILSITVQKGLVKIVKDVEGMGFEKGSNAFARAFLQMSMLNRDTIKLKLEKLGGLGFTEEEVGSLVKKLPQLLGFSEDTLRRKLKFLIEEWKLPRNAILNDPALLCYSIEKRLKPRLNAVSSLMMKNKSSQKTKYHSSLKYLRMSDGDFNTKVVSRLPVATQENEEENLF